MPGTLPVPLTCEVPQGWQAAPPDEVGAPQAALVALHLASKGEGFVPNITVTGRTRTDAAGLTRIAEESIRRLQEAVGTVHVVKRAEVGTSEAPGLVDAPGVVQNLHIDATVNGQPMKLAQSQLFLILENEQRPNERAEVEIALTAKAEQLHEVLEDFQDFLRTVRPASQGEVDGSQT
ncbi:hypothetical protein RM572_08580 [Streptomyces sp. DSM 42041]|uniref:DUF1795 domain-containing protein n=1 Tax=Streptomyces hazeniae TaxID=3075538 RepID=A0ABU2NQ06_9ACTN|nr:hypothetical protein [Streptomyces sp. DSM 42041]MDT0378829.1 hypothetical protein [Streptomyces sp. DSM 42041]